MIRTRRHRKPSSAVCSQTLPIPAPTLTTCRGCQLGLLSKNRGTSKPCGPLPRLPASVSPPTLRSSLRGPKYPGVHRPPAQARENQAEMLGRRLAGKAGRAVHHPQPSPLSTMTFSEPKPRSPPPRPCRWLRPCHCAPEGSSPPPSRTHLGGGLPCGRPGCAWTAASLCWPLRAMTTGGNPGRPLSGPLWVPGPTGQRVSAAGLRKQACSTLPTRAGAGCGRQRQHSLSRQALGCPRGQAP